MQIIKIDGIRHLFRKGDFKTVNEELSILLENFSIPKEYTAEARFLSAWAALFTDKTEISIKEFEKIVTKTSSENDRGLAYAGMALANQMAGTIEESDLLLEKATQNITTGNIADIVALYAIIMAERKEYKESKNSFLIALNYSKAEGSLRTSAIIYLFMAAMVLEEFPNDPFMKKYAESFVSMAIQGFSQEESFFIKTAQKMLS